jgi:hypothetical protein
MNRFGSWREMLLKMGIDINTKKNSDWFRQYYYVPTINKGNTI